MKYWPAVDVLKQVSMELGLELQNTVVSADNPQGSQLLAALNSAGNELLTYYPWAQFSKEFEIVTLPGVSDYALPDDWSYFRDQTQWDKTNHWPLLGPKTPAEWAYIKSGNVAGFPRIRFRVKDNKFCIHPAPEAEFHLTMEYISDAWVQPAGQLVPTAQMVVQDGDILWYQAWLLVKFVKLKFYQLKGFDPSGVAADFTRVFESLVGKDSGAPVLSLTNRSTPMFIGPQSIPDGSWNV